MITISAFSCEGTLLACAQHDSEALLRVDRAYQPGDRIEVRFDPELSLLSARDEAQKGAKIIKWGELYLGTDAKTDLPCPDIDSFTLKDPARAAFTDKNGKVYAPLTHITFEEEKEIQKSRIQIIF